MSIKKECVIVTGNQKCCEFTVAEGEEEEAEGEGDDVEEEESQKSWSLVAALKKILSLPICLLCKRKEVDLLPGSVKERAETLSIANCTRLESEAPELEVDDNNLMLPLSIVLLQVPSGSLSSSHLFYPTEDFAICHLQSALCALQEDIT